MDKTDTTLTLYTVQRKPIAEMLQNGETYMVQKRFIRQKYGEVSRVFLAAYEWFAAAAAAVVPRPEGAESAVWAFPDAQDAYHGEEDCTLTLRVPAAQAILFDMFEWNDILNARPLGTPAQRAAYDAELRRQGIRDASLVTSSPFYPALKAQLTQSWAQLFRHDAALKAGEETTVPHVQAALWCIRPEWVIKTQ